MKLICEIMKTDGHKKRRLLGWQQVTEMNLKWFQIGSIASKSVLETAASARTSDDWGTTKVYGGTPSSEWSGRTTKQTHRVRTANQPNGDLLRKLSGAPETVSYHKEVVFSASDWRIAIRSQANLNFESRIRFRQTRARLAILYIFASIVRRF